MILQKPTTCRSEIHKSFNKNVGVSTWWETKNIKSVWRLDLKLLTLRSLQRLAKVQVGSIPIGRSICLSNDRGTFPTNSRRRLHPSFVVNPETPSTCEQ
jgi:hypothetical protein